jgi:hypothetical protein
MMVFETIADALRSNDILVADDLRLTLRIDQDRTIRMKSRTFWNSRFGIVRRTLPRIAAISELLEGRHIKVVSGTPFGSEPLNSMLTLRLMDAEPWPSDEWFARMATRTFESEVAVEAKFVLPLLEALGYHEDDICQRWNVTISKGHGRETKTVDLALFDGPARIRPLMLAEVKKPHPKRGLLTSAAIQAQSYAYWSGTPLWILTDADETRLYRHGTPGNAVEVTSFDRNNLANEWPTIVKYLSRESIVDRASSLSNKSLAVPSAES